MSGGPRVLFVGHDASRSGAPVVLRSFLAWLKETQESNAELVLLRGGPLVADFRTTTPTAVLESRVDRVGHQADRLRASMRSEPLRHHLGDWSLRRRLHAPGTDIIVCNTLAALADVATHAPDRVPLVCHVHELDGVAGRVLPSNTAERRRTLARVSRFVAAGPAVREMLVERWGLPAARVAVVDEFIDTPPPQFRTRDRAAGSAPLVVSLGIASPRKGIDSFVELAANDPPGTSRSFRWVGGDPASAAWQQAEFDIAAAGLTSRVKLVSTTDDTWPHLAAADVAVSTAREDPYPLAMLEAAAVATPILAFDSGGVADLAAEADVEQCIVGAGDVGAMSDRLARLGGDLGERERIGGLLQHWVLGTHLTEHLAPQLWARICEAA